MPIPGEYNLTLYQGDSFTLPITVNTGDPPAPMDYTGATIKAQVKRRYRDSTALAEFAVSDIGSTPGRFVISLTPVQTQALPENSVWDLQITDSLGDVRTYLAGYVTTTREVTT